MAMPVTVKVSLFYSGAWQDITTYVYWRDLIQISRGTQNNATTADPSSCTLTLNNRDGRFSLRNPASPLYGLIGRNTPLKVERCLAGGTLSTAFVGEISAWPISWDTTRRDIYCQIQAAGVLRRLGQGQKAPVYNALGVFVTGTGYESCYSGATQTDIPGTNTMQGQGPAVYTIAGGDMGLGARCLQITATFTQRDGNGFPTTGYLYSTGTVYSATSTVASAMVFQGQGIGQFSLYANTYFGFPEACQFEVRCRADATNDVQLITRYTDTSGALTVATQGTSAGNLTALTDGLPHVLTFQLTKSGSDATYDIRLDNVSVLTGTATGLVRMVDSLVDWLITYEPPDLSVPINIAYITQWRDTIPSFTSLVQPVNGFIAEAAGTRISRLCTAQSVTLASSGTLTDTALMGATTSTGTLAQISEAAATDMGLLFDTRAAVGLTYLTRKSLYNPLTAVTLDYSTFVFGAPPNPTDDDLNLHNQITASDTSGNSSTASLDTGPLSTQSPPNGIGQYPTTYSANTYQPVQLPDIASWQLALSTVNAARFPALTINMLNPHVTSNGTLVGNVVALDVGQRVVITNLPAIITPNSVSLLAVGFRESLTQTEWTITANCLPGQLYDVAVYGTDRFDAENSTVGTGFTSSATSLSIVSAANTTLWMTTATSAADFPFDINIGGERITVTAISGSTSPQTFTVTRSVNGIVKAHVAGEAVNLWKQARYAL